MASVIYLSKFLSNIRHLISEGKKDEALVLIEKGLTYFPRNIELQSMLYGLPPSTVDYTEERDKRARNAAARYYDILDYYFKRRPISILEIGSGQGSWIDTARTRYSISSENTVAVDGPWAMQVSLPNENIIADKYLNFLANISFE